MLALLQCPPVERHGLVECLRDIVRRAPHTLSDAEEKLLADAAPLAGSASNIYGILTNADFPYPTITLSDGRVLRQHVEHATGTAERPMSDRDIETKFRALCEPYLPASQIASLIDRCWNITDVQDAATFAQLASVR